jgi:phosphate transport system permease protein
VADGARVVEGHSMSSAFTGRTRRRTTTRAVRSAERAARVLITAGGLGTILAVTTICAFLVWVVVPLFGGADAQAGPVGAAPAALRETAPLQLGLDESHKLAWALLPGGKLVALGLPDGQELEQRELFPERQVTAAHAGSQPGARAFGFQDGSVQLARVGFSARRPTGEELTAELRALPVGGSAACGQGLAVRGADGELSVRELSVVVEPPVRSGSASAVTRLAHSVSEAQTRLTVLKADGTLVRTVVRRKTNLLTGAVTTSTEDLALPWLPRPEAGPPTHLLQSPLADNLYLAWDDGRVQRVDATDPAAPRVAESTQLVPPGRKLTALTQLAGDTTLLAGDSGGGLRAWFTVRDVNGEPRLQLAHQLPEGSSAVTALEVSRRNRIAIAGHADGRIRVLHVTSQRTLAELDGGEPVHALALAPGVDGLLADGLEHVRLWSLSAPHPETSLAALFTPVWYEGLQRPEHVWQSSAGTDEFEPKLGLWPLVFGTLKASLYSLLFAVPVALLAAVYTSEFLSRRWRARVKPAIEMMASLPSVVLGFLAAIVVAPMLEGVVPQTLAAMFCVPLALMLGAHLWQLVPQQRALRWSGWPRFALMFLFLGAGVLVARGVGPALERGWFAGDIKAWLDGQIGDGTGGWMFLLLPLAVLLVGLARARWLSPRIRRLQNRWTRGRSALLDLAIFFAAVLAVWLVTRTMAGALDGMGLDPRGGLMSTYVQRNAMVVGFLTGFAVVPIVYTLAEDALSSVPDHLRAASLASGATPWQTALHVVVPTAMSGLFSSVMIGVGRVVGETMIVLMAAGNTPVLDWNLFNGFRTLSATIAVELPEAVQDGTLYRVLFLAALVLFAMTFVINTLAEMVRLRFRKRAYEL